MLKSNRLSFVAGLLSLLMFVGLAQAHERRAEPAPTATAVSASGAIALSGSAAQVTTSTLVTASPATTVTTGPTDVNVQANQVRQAPAVIGSGLVAASNTCMGSTSVGGSGVGFGFSVGSTWTDGDCNARSDAALLHNMGLTTAALQRLCERPELAKALKASGTYQCRDVAQ